MRYNLNVELVQHALYLLIDTLTGGGGGGGGFTVYTRPLIWIIYRYEIGYYKQTN